MSTSALIDGSDDAWSEPCPSLDRVYIAVATPVTAEGYKRKLRPTELRFLHGALTAVIGRPHGASVPFGAPARPRAQSPDWSLVPVDTPSGWGAVWWSKHDGLAYARSRHAARIGHVPVVIDFGPAMKIRTPPEYVAAAHPLRLTAVTPVCTRRNLFRDDPKRRHTEWRTEPTSQSLEAMVVSLAAKMGISAKPMVAMVSSDTRQADVRLGGKIGTRRGWIGGVQIVANAPARWILECASRGLGIGHSVSYGLGRVSVVPV